MPDERALPTAAQLVEWHKLVDICQHEVAANRHTWTWEPAVLVIDAEREANLAEIERLRQEVARYRNLHDQIHDYLSEVPSDAD